MGHIVAYSPHPWGSDTMTKGVVPREAITTAMDTAKFAQVLSFVKENQILTAICVYVLWQTGAFFSALGYVQGGMC